MLQLTEGQNRSFNAGEACPTRIVYVINSLRAGGTERHLVRLISGLLPTRRWHVSVYCLGRTGPFVEELEAKGVHVAGPLGPRSVSMRALVSSIVSLTTYLRQNRPQIVHCYLAAAGLIGTISARLAGVPYVITTRRGAEFHRPSVLELLRHRAADAIADLGSDVVIAVSQFSTNRALREGTPERKLVTIYNGVESHQPSSVRRWKFTGKPVFGTVGSLLDVKGHEHLLKAMQQVLASLPEALCIIVGDGPERSRLAQLALEAGVSRRIEFLGQQKDIGGILQALDIFVLPSLIEGLPNALLEAMMAGLPVISTRVGGVPEIVDEDITGVLVAPGSCEELARAMIRLGADTAARHSLGQRGREKAVTCFSPEAEIEQTTSVYRELLIGPGREAT